MPGVWLPRDPGLLPPDHPIEDSRLQLLPRVRADDLCLHLEACLEREVHFLQALNRPLAEEVVAVHECTETHSS